MDEVIARPGDVLLMESLKYEPCVRAYIRGLLGLSGCAKSELLDDLLLELQGRVVQMTTPPARRGSGLKKLLLKMTQDLLAEVWSSNQVTATLQTDKVADGSDRGARSVDVLSDIEVSEHRALCSVVAKVQDLPDLTRWAFTLRKVYGFTAAEIAERLNLTEGAVEQHLVASARAVASAAFEEQPS
jgi:DNA-directed RNA polymerase specialized sigma24 family protein